MEAKPTQFFRNCSLWLLSEHKCNSWDVNLCKVKIIMPTSGYRAACSPFMCSYERRNSMFFKMQPPFFSLFLFIFFSPQRSYLEKFLFLAFTVMNFPLLYRADQLAYWRIHIGTAQLQVVLPANNLMALSQPVFFSLSVVWLWN